MIHHTSYALVHEDPPVCSKCGVAMFSGFTQKNVCTKCQANEQQSSGPTQNCKGSDWQDTAPTVPGQWLLRCDEGGDNESPVDVRLDNGLLMAVDPDFGYLPVHDLHEGLTNPQWRPA